MVKHFTESTSEIVKEKKEEKEKNDFFQLNVMNELSYWFWYILGGVFFGLMLLASRGVLV